MLFAELDRLVVEKKTREKTSCVSESWDLVGAAASSPIEWREIGDGQETCGRWAERSDREATASGTLQN